MAFNWLYSLMVDQRIYFSKTAKIEYHAFNIHFRGLHNCTYTCVC